MEDLLGPGWGEASEVSWWEAGLQQDWLSKDPGPGTFWGWEAEEGSHPPAGQCGLPFQAPPTPASL